MLRAYHELNDLIHTINVKPNYLITICLLICMVFSTSASAFLHLNEHKLELSHIDLSYSEQHAAFDKHEEHDASAEHAHHFNLHVTADLVEHDSIVFFKSANLISVESAIRLVSRSYTPPIPPPNA